jgi:hypothetical protein
MRRELILLIVFLAFGAAANADTFYISNSGGSVTCNGGTQNTSAPSFFNNGGNWANPKVSGKIGPGDTVYLCGTFTGAVNTTLLQVQKSGSSGSPITVKFDTGADLTSPAWGATGAIDCGGQSFITIDGGTNGKIENTADGDALAYQIVTAGVNSSGGACVNLTVQNLTVSNLYIKTEDSNNNTDDSAGINYGSANALITHNTIDHAATGIGMAGVNGVANQEISFNTLSFCQHCIAAGAGSSATADGIKIHDNDIGGGAYLWDNSNNNYHHNAIIMVCENGVNPCIKNLMIYNNYIHGKWSVTGHTTSMFFLDDYETSGISGTVFNNFISLDPADVGTGDGIIDGGRYVGFYNNTISLPYNDKCFSVWNYPDVTLKNNICSQAGAGTGIASISGEKPQNGGVKPDNNLYYGVSSWSYGTGSDTYSQWIGECGCDSHSQNGKNPQLNSDGTLQAGSPAIGAGTNLTGLGVTPLDSDKAWVLRPSSGSWDLSAYQTSSQDQNPPAPPTNLVSVVQ